MTLPPPSSLAALRQLLAERFPPAVHAADAALATGIPAVDSVAGGLPRPGLTELVCSAPSCGSQLFLGQLLLVTRQLELRVALIDHGDTFDPGSWPASVLEHLVWIRPRQMDEALAVTDVLVRDANLGLLVLDLGQAAPVELRRIPATRWHRLQRAIGSTSMAGLILSPQPLVPSARLRLVLAGTQVFSDQSRPELTAALTPGLLRQRTPHLATTG